MSTALVLKRKQYSASKRERRIATVLFLALLVAGIAVFYPLFESIDWSEARYKASDFPRKLLSGGIALAEMVVVVLAGIAHFWYAARAKKLERLFLDERGIRYQSALPGWLARLQPSWSHAWAQIAGARIVIPKLVLHPNVVTVVLDAVTVQRKIQGMWIPVEREEDANGSGMFLFSSHQAVAAQITREIDESPLVQHLRRMGVTVERREAPRAGFALERNRAALVALVLIFALMAYAAVDWMVNTETYAVKPPVVLYVLAGALVMLACGVTLAAKEVPAAESWGVSIVLGAAFTAALYPGLLRVNQLTDADGLRAYEYRMKDYGVWEPRNIALPELRFTDYPEYWSLYQRGAEKEFLLRRGALGFFQVEMAPVRAEMRKHYRGD